MSVPGNQRLLRLAVSFLECEFYTLDEDEFQNHKVVLNITKNVSSLIAIVSRKQGWLQEEKCPHFREIFFSSPPHCSGQKRKQRLWSQIWNCLQTPPLKIHGQKDSKIPIINLLLINWGSNKSNNLTKINDIHLANILWRLEIMYKSLACCLV